MTYVSMSSVTRIYVTLAVVVSCLVMGCSSEEKTADPIPADLAMIESATEAAFDKALAGDVPAVQEQARQLSEAWTRYQPQASRDGVPASALQQLDAAVQGFVTAAANRSVSAIDAARAANAISAPLDEIYAVYKPPIPTQLLKLDYLGREVVLDAKQGDFRRASGDVDRLDSTWQSLRANVVSSGGGGTAGQMDASIAAQRTAIAGNNATNLEAAARQELEVVDSIEQIFAKSADTAD